MVSQVDDPDYPSFPCYNLTTNTCNPRETTRSLLFSLLPPAGSRPLLPAIDCRRGFRKMRPSILSDASPKSTRNFAPCTLPPAISLLMARLPHPPVWSPAALPPITEPHNGCALATPLVVPMLVPTIAAAAASKPAAPAPPPAADAACAHATPLVIAPTDAPPVAGAVAHPLTAVTSMPACGTVSVLAPPVRLNLNSLPLAELRPSKVYVRRSSRINKAYDGSHVGVLDRASRRVAAQDTVSSSSSGSQSKGKRQKRSKRIEDLLHMPIKASPSPLSKKRIKEIAKMCGLSGPTIVKAASSVAPPVSDD